MEPQEAAFLEPLDQDLLVWGALCGWADLLPPSHEHTEEQSKTKTAVYREVQEETYAWLEFSPIPP